MKVIGTAMSGLHLHGCLLLGLASPAVRAEVEGENSTKAPVAPLTECVPDTRKVDFVAPLVSQDFLNLFNCIDPDGSLGIANDPLLAASGPDAYFISNFIVPAKLVFDSNPQDEYFGPDPEDSTYTDILRKIHTDIQSFFSLSEEVQGLDPLIGQMPLYGFHGSFYSNFDQALSTYVTFSQAYNRTTSFGNATSSAMMGSIYGGDVDTLVACLEPFVESPLMTLNAFYSVPSTGNNGRIPGIALGPAIYYGDGFIEFLGSVFDKSDPSLPLSSFHGHEYAHHITSLLGVAVIGSSPEETRSSELLADALSSYFNAHACGNAYGSDELNTVASVFMLTGDCFFEAISHHGTPDQRRCASLWGAYVARSSMEVMDPSEFIKLFMEAEPKILAVDVEETCPPFESAVGLEIMAEDITGKCSHVQPTGSGNGNGEEADISKSDTNEDAENNNSSGGTLQWSKSGHSVLLVLTLGLTAVFI